MSEPWQDAEVLKNLYWDEGMSYSEMSSELGCSESTLSRWMSRHGIETRSDFETGGKWTDKQVLEELYNGKGLSLSDMSEKLGCSESTIGRWMDKYEIERTPPMKDITGPWQDKEKLENYYLKKSMSINDIADHFDVDYQTIRRWLHIHEIPVRSRGKPLEQSVLVRTTKEGYVRCIGEDSNYAYIHRLLAAVDHDLDDMKGKHVHHKNGIKWDYRPENIEVLSPERHMQKHNNG